MKENQFHSYCWAINNSARYATRHRPSSRMLLPFFSSHSKWFKHSKFIYFAAKWVYTIQMHCNSAIIKHRLIWLEWVKNVLWDEDQNISVEPRLVRGTWKTSRFLIGVSLKWSSNLTNWLFQTVTSHDVIIVFRFFEIANQWM